MGGQRQNGPPMTPHTPEGPTHLVQRCTATRRDGTQCRNAPIRGATVCRMHGGRAPQVRRKAAANVVLAKAEKAMAGMHLDPAAREGDWIDSLELVLARLRGLEAHVGKQVGELSADRIRSTDAKGAEQVHGLLAAYMGILKQLGDAAAKIGALDLESVRVRVEAKRTEYLTARLEAALSASLTAAGVEGDQRATALTKLAEILREGA